MISTKPTPRKNRTIEEQIAAAKIGAAKIGATYEGWEIVGGQKFFRFSKPGYDNRLCILGNLEIGQNPFNLRTIEEQVAAVKRCAKELGAAYLRYERVSQHNHFWISKPGYEDRLTTLSRLESGANPFNKATIGEQVLAVKLHAAKFGATYENEYECREKSKTTYFKLSKPGFEDRMITRGHVERGDNPFNKATINEQVVAVKLYAAKLGAVYVRYEKINNTNHFWLSKPGYEDRLTPLGSLKFGYNPFNMATIFEQETRVKEFAHNWGSTYENEYEKREGQYYFKLSKPGFDCRWTSLGGLDAGNNPFGRPTIGEQEVEARMLATSIGATYENEYEKKDGKNFFKLSKPGYENRLSTLGDLKTGKNPFNRPSLGEQEAAVKVFATNLGASYENEYEKRGSRNYFKFSKPGYEERWSALTNLDVGNNPFRRPTIGEQEAELRGYASRFQAKYTGVVKRDKSKKSHNKFELARPGYDNIFITLSDAKKAIDPFSGGGGFDASKPGYNYLLLVTEENGAQCVKTGITNRLPTRLSAHRGELKTAGATFELLYKTHCKDGAKTLARETALKRLFKAYRTQVEYAPGVELSGFAYHGGECFHIGVKKDLIDTLKKLAGNSKRLKGEK